MYKIEQVELRSTLDKFIQLNGGKRSLKIWSMELNLLVIKIMDKLLNMFKTK